jgi:hypothetical protein
MQWNVTAEHWVLGMCEVRNGKAYFAHGKDLLLCPKNFAFFWPAHALTKSEDKGAEVNVTFHIYSALAPANLPKQPILFIPPNWSLPPKFERVAEYIEAGTKKLAISGIKSPSYLVEQAKSFVDEEFKNTPAKEFKIADLAFKLRTNSAALSRDFKTATGISLSDYRELVRKFRDGVAAFANAKKLPEKIELKSETLSLTSSLIAKR